jgi:hypothetical protein
MWFLQEASNIRIKRIIELGTVIANALPISLILFTWTVKQYIPSKHRFLQEPRNITFQEMAFFNTS